jgi:cyclohexyl-isocyanide hydratase
MSAGLLEGRRAGCHCAWREFLPLFGAVPDPGSVVRDGNIITGGCVTAGIDFAMTVIAELTDARIARCVQLVLEYTPVPPFDAGTPDRVLPADVHRARRAQLSIA